MKKQQKNNNKKTKKKTKKKKKHNTSGVNVDNLFKTEMVFHVIFRLYKKNVI